MDTIKRILGEAESDNENEPKKKPETGKTEKVERPESDSNSPDVDTATRELANLWNTGNREDVALRFMEMSNVEAVRLVFAIDREGALELARMADEIMEERETPEGTEGEGSTEPARIEPPAEAEPAPVSDRDYVHGIIGNEPVEA